MLTKKFKILDVINDGYTLHINLFRCYGYDSKDELINALKEMKAEGTIRYNMVEHELFKDEIAFSSIKITSLGKKILSEELSK